MNYDNIILFSIKKKCSCLKFNLVWFSLSLSVKGSTGEHAFVVTGRMNQSTVDTMPRITHASQPTINHCGWRAQRTMAEVPLFIKVAAPKVSVLQIADALFVENKEILFAILQMWCEKTLYIWRGVHLNTLLTFSKIYRNVGCTKIIQWPRV